MKKYKTDDMMISVRVVRTQPHEVVLNIQYAKDDEQEIVLPADCIKRQFSDNAFAKHLLNFFIKE